MKKFYEKKYSDEAVEAAAGLGVIGGGIPGAYYLGKVKKSRDYAKARVEAEDRARAARDKLSKGAKKIRFQERLKNNPKYAKNKKIGLIGTGIALGSGLGYGLYEKFKDPKNGYNRN